MDAMAIANSAEQYYYTCKLLNEKIGKLDFKVTLPTFTNRIFALELYLKSLIFIEAEKVKMDHSIKNLYRQLSHESKEFIEHHYYLYIKQSPIIAARLKMFPDIDLSINTSLNDLHNAYNKMRYIYEGDIPNITGLSPLLEATRLRVRTLLND